MPSRLIVESKREASSVSIPATDGLASRISQVGRSPERIKMNDTMWFVAVLFVSMAPCIMLWLVVRPARKQVTLRDLLDKWDSDRKGGPR